MAKADDLRAKIGLGGPPLGHIRSAPPTIPDHEMVRCIGQGSYGEVWLARSTVGTYRAVKVVYRDNFKDARPYEREFSGIQKYEPISRSNEGLVDVLQIGRNDAEGYFYYVMELADDAGGPEVRGQRSEARSQSLEATLTRPADTLSHRMGEGRGEGSLSPDDYAPKTLSRELQHRGRLPFEECIQLGLTLNLALGHLHRNGLIHRDVKPSNIIFVSGVPKLADIGLVTDSADAQSFVGTEGFIPPEGPNSAQADIYALGKVLYEASMGKDRQEFPEPFTRLGLDAESKALMELNAVLLKACAAPKQRYQSAEEMNVDLALLHSGKSVKQKHAVERRLKLATRTVAVAGMVALIALTGYFYQRFETSEARRLSNENRDLAEQNQRKAEENRRQLVQVKVANGIRLAQEGSLYAALLWFADALPLVGGDPVQEAAHRLRFQSILRQCPKLVQIFVHKGSVNWCEFSPDGSRVVTASTDGTARIWDARNGIPATPALEHEGKVWMAVFSSDGKWVATGSEDGTAMVWDAVTGKPRTPPLQHKHSVRRVRFSPNGERLVTTGGGHHARIWDAATGKEATPALQHESAVSSVEFSPDGRYVLTASADKTARLWDANTGAPVLKPFQHPLSVIQATFSPDGKRMATLSRDSSDSDESGEARIWEVISGDLVFSPLKCSGLDSFPYALTFSPDGTMLAIRCAHSKSQVWNLKGKEPKAQIVKHIEITHMAFSPDGSLLATASESQGSQVWDTKAVEPAAPLLLLSDWDNHVAFHPSGNQVIIGSEDGTAKIWDLRVGNRRELTLRHQYPVGQAHFNKAGTEVLTAAGHLYVWDAKSGKLLAKSKGKSGQTQAIYSPDEKVILGNCANGSSESASNQLWIASAHLWDARTGEPFGIPLQHSNRVFNSVFNPTGDKIATASTDKTARIWDTATQSPLTPAMNHKGPIRCINFSPDGLRVVTASQDRTARVWDATTGEAVLPPLIHASEVDFAVFTPDGGTILTTGMDQRVHCWNAQTGGERIPPVKMKGRVMGVSLSPDAKRIVQYGLSSDAHVLDVATGTRTLPLLRGADRYSEFSKDGTKILTCGKEGTAIVWDATTGELLVSLKNLGEVHYASFSPDSQRFVTASQDQTARIWSLEKCDYPMEDISKLAQLLAGHHIDGYGSLSPVNPTDLLTMLQTLRSSIPQYFNVSVEEDTAWRLEKIEHFEQTQQWFGAIWQLTELTKSTPKAPELYQRRGTAFAESGLWREAAQDFSSVIELSAGEFRNYKCLAYATLGSGNQMNYQAVCDKLLRQFGKTNDAHIADSLACLCVLVPNIVLETNQIIQLCEMPVFLSAKSPGTICTLGAACFRAGRFQEALEQFRLGRSLGGGGSYYYVFEAMTQFRMGNRDEARYLLEKAVRRIETRTGQGDAEAADTKIPWQERLRLQLLRREAEALIGIGNSPTNRSTFTSQVGSRAPESKSDVSD